MKFVIDANLSQRWVEYLQARGYEASYWSLTHDAEAPDLDIIHFAAALGAVVLTQDLDFGMHLSDLKLSAPSVIQLRSNNTNPEQIGRTVVQAIQDHTSALQDGALLTVDLRSVVRMRINLLPL